MACIPLLPHGCIDNASTSHDASKKDTSLPGVFFLDTKDRGGFYSHASISRVQLPGEIGGSPVSNGRRGLGYGALCTMGLSHLEYEEPVAFPGRQQEKLTDGSPE